VCQIGGFVTLATLLESRDTNDSLFINVFHLASNGLTLTKNSLLTGEFEVFVNVEDLNLFSRWLGNDPKGPKGASEYLSQICSIFLRIQVERNALR
jgi:hypothetical protein